MKMSIFGNSTWRTAAILKIIIFQYLSRNLSEFHETLERLCGHKFYPRRGNVTKITNFEIQDGGPDAILKIIFLLITRLHRVRLRRNLEFGGIISSTRRLDDENVQFRKSNMADGRHFENHYISISQPQIVQIARNLVCRHKFYCRRWKRQKSEIYKFKMADGRRIENHFWAITELHVVPLR